MTNSARGRLPYPKLAAAAAIAALALTATGCGGSDDTSSSTAASTTSSTAEATGPPVVSNDVAVSETEYALTPSNVLPDTGDGGPPTSKAKAGQVTFTITNDGDYIHNFVFNNAGKEIPIDGDLAPGESTELTVDVTSGYYEYYCTIDNHQGRGMQGQLQVVD
jgi:uncharacterized cupredoxin-like copper-binding protein